MKFCANKAPSAQVRVRCSRNIARASSPAPVATCRCSPRRPNSRAAPVGQVSISRLKTRLARPRTVLSECCGPKSTAAAAVAISVTSSTMDRSRPGYATASTALHWCFARQRRQQAEAEPRQLLPARQLCPGLWTGAFSFKLLKHIHLLVWHSACDRLFRLRPFCKLGRPPDRIGDDVMGIFDALNTSVAG